MKERPASPVYLLSGREQFFVRRALEILRAKVLASPDMNELLYHVLYASETNADDLLGLARTMPFFDRTQLMLVYEAEKVKDPLGRMLVEYAEDPSPFTCLVLVVGEDLPKRALFKSLEKSESVTSLAFPWLKGAPRRAWLLELAGERGFSPRDSGAWVRGLLAGGDVSLEVLDNQLEIMNLYLGGGGSRGLDDPLPFLFSDIPSEQSYRLTDPLLEGKGQEAMEALGRFLEQGTPPLVLFHRMVWEARRLWRIQDALVCGRSVQSVCGSMRIPPFKVGLYASAAERVERVSLAKLFLGLNETERLLKMGSRLDPRWHLEEACKRFVRVTRGRTIRKAG